MSSELAEQHHRRSDRGGDYSSSRGRWVTHAELGEVSTRLDAVHAEVLSLPDKVINETEKRRRQSRVKFCRDVFSLLVGISTIVGAVAGVIYLWLVMK